MTREEARADLMLAQADISYRPKDDSIDMAIEALENQKTGHWINRLNIYANRTIDTKVCSECQYEYSYDAETGISNANFCPNCGAKMKGE